MDTVKEMETNNDTTKNTETFGTSQDEIATTTTDETKKTKSKAKKAGTTGKKGTSTKKPEGRGVKKKSRSKLTPAHKKYLEGLITRTPTLMNTTLRDKLLTKFNDIDSIDPTTIGRFLKNELGVQRRRIIMTEKEKEYFEKHGNLPR